MLWRISADTHVRIGTLPNSFSPSATPDRLADNESALSDREGLLSDTDLLGILRKEENAASNYQWSALSQTREDALNYYDREPYGDEQDGASQVVTSEFADVIESIMPGLMRVFTSTDDVAEFSPGAPGEERWAKEANYWSGKRFASCDPSQWPDDMELSVNVGLGTGNKDQAIH